MSRGSDQPNKIESLDLRDPIKGSEVKIGSLIGSLDKPIGSLTVSNQNLEEITKSRDPNLHLDPLQDPLRFEIRT